MKTRCILIASISSLGLLFALPSNAKPDFPKTAEDVLIVDCLLPGQVRKLGRMNSFLSQRCPARLSQFECALRGGEYVEYDRANLQTALSVWLAAASGGDVAAMVMVGEAFAKGAGQAPDYGQAVFWFQRASNAGNKRAQQNLGHLYELGLGVAADREKALNFYRMASAVAGERVVFTSTLATETMLQAQLTDVSKDLDAERAKRAALESEVSTLKARLNATQADAAAKRAEVARLKRAVAAAPKPAEVAAMWLVLEEQIRGKELEIAAQSTELAKLERAMLGGAAAPTATLSTAQLGQVKLTIVQPLLLAGLGAPTALATSSEPVALIGRITPRAVLNQLWVGANLVQVDAEGLFRANLAVSDVSRIQITALDEKGARNAFDFTLVGPKSTPSSISVNATAAPNGTRIWPAGLKAGKRWLLAIGNQNYQNYPDLAASIDDAEAVAEVLAKNYGFQAKVLRDASKLDLLLALDEIRRTAGADDDVIVYFAGNGELSTRAGHGELSTRAGNGELSTSAGNGKLAGASGSWVPSDGIANQANTWLPNKVVSDTLASMPARNVLVLADSCCAGTLTAAAVPRASASLSGGDWAAWAKASGAGRSRMALTSGGVRPVFDAKVGGSSLFSAAILKVLRRNQGVLEAQTLYQKSSHLLALTSASDQLTDLPTFAPIAFAGHERGELLLAGK